MLGHTAGTTTRAAIALQINCYVLLEGKLDLHVSSVSPEHPALSAHVVVSDQSLADAEHLVRDLEQRLCDRFGIGHSTIQVESCHPCAEIGHGAGDHNHPHPATL